MEKREDPVKEIDVPTTAKGDPVPGRQDSSTPNKETKKRKRENIPRPNICRATTSGLYPAMSRGS
mgnify:CR=1 FL=1